MALAHIDTAERRERSFFAEKPERIQQLEALGWERTLIYKSLVLTGLRKGELVSLTVGQLEFDRSVAYIVLHPRDEKNRQGSEIPLRTDLAADLKTWLSYRIQAAQKEATRRGDPMPVNLAPNMPLYSIRFPRVFFAYLIRT